MLGMLEDAQQAALPFASIPDIGAIGILGLIAVFVYRFLPRLVERAMDEHRRSVEQFAGQLRAEREYFERQMQLERDACRDQFEMVLTRHDEQQRQTIAALQRIENEIHQR